MSRNSAHDQATLLKEERHALLLQILGREGKLLASELSERLHVSEDTIRRDLREMASGLQLQRVHGGALPRNPSPAYTARTRQSVDAKNAIAEAAAGLVRDGQLVLMDGGTSTLQLALCLPSQVRATIVTNSPPIAVALSAHPRIETILLGGRINKQEQVTTGASTVDELRGYRADICFLGVCSLHPEAGIGVPEVEEAQMKRAMIARSAEVAALVTASKLVTTSPYIVAPASSLTYLITDPAADPRALASYRALGVTVIVGKQ
jgi:DeoR/GlpR family transcriptional regulator of sugar metabolism